MQYKTIGIDMNNEMVEELKRQAASANLPMGPYVISILEEWLVNEPEPAIEEK